MFVRCVIVCVCVLFLLRKERKLFDMFKEAASNRPDKKEREEIESLRSEVCTYVRMYRKIVHACTV